jgi:uncharacterized RDD family membrane protein YckC
MSYVAEPPPSQVPEQTPTPSGEDVLGRRIGGALLDLAVLTVLFIVMALTMGESSSGSLSLNGWPALLFFALALLYYFALEAATGQTIGKRLLGLRVVSDDGHRPSTGAIAIRTLLRIIDALPILYLVGFITILATGAQRKRLGDLAAKTRVVRD